MQWSWEAIQGADAPTLLSLLNRRMKTLEFVVRNLFQKQIDADAKVLTTDATVTVLATEAIPVSTTVGLCGYVTARRTGGAAGSAEDGATYRVEFCAKNAAGTAALIGAGTVTVIGESQAGWDITLVASGGNILVKVTGAANNNVSWVWGRYSLSVQS